MRSCERSIPHRVCECVIQKLLSNWTVNNWRSLSSFSLRHLTLIMISIIRVSSWSRGAKEPSISNRKERRDRVSIVVLFDYHQQLGGGQLRESRRNGQCRSGSRMIRYQMAWELGGASEATWETDWHFGPGQREQVYQIGGQLVRPPGSNDSCALVLDVGSLSSRLPIDDKLKWPTKLQPAARNVGSLGSAWPR